MKKLILLAFLLAALLSFAEESGYPAAQFAPVNEEYDPFDDYEMERSSTSFGYYNMKMGPLPIPVPEIGFGYRFHKGSFGVDLGFTGYSIVVVSGAKLSFAPLYYTPADVYFGLGGQVQRLSILSLEGGVVRQNLFSPLFMIGRQFQRGSKRQKFVQFEYNPILYRTEASPVEHGLNYALLNFSYGVQF